ncbi:MAG TPA: hypothetical protein VMP00_01270 [Burkholderiales bacterium]|nr:hypothetical protein [Burkholderiales bacterium]
MVISVTGTPIRACAFQSMRMLRRCAALTTMMLAMLPTISRPRLPSADPDAPVFIGE